MIDKEVHKGKWFIPLQKDTQFDGTMIFTVENENHLEIHGTFQKHQFDYNSQPVIWGLTADYLKITLFNSSFRTSTNNKITKYSPSFILIGGHFEDEEAINFKKLVCRIYPLDDWISTIFYEQTKLWFEHKLIIHPRPEIIAPISKDLSIRIVFEKRFEEAWNFNKYVKQEIVTLLLLETNTSISFKDYLHQLYVFNNFLSFATGKESFPLRLTFRNEDPQENSEDSLVKLLFQHTKIKSIAKSIEPIDMLFTFPMIENQFNSIIKEWFILFDKHQICFEMFYEALLSNTQFRVRHFLNIINALEALHRRLRNINTKKKEHIQGLIDKMLAVIEDEKDYKSLSRRLKYFSEPSLLERLIDFKNNFTSGELKKLIPNKDIDTSVAIRNYYSHPDEKKENQDYLDIDCIYDLFRKNRLLLVSIILKFLKFDNEAYDRIINDEIQDYKSTAANTQYT